MQKLQPVAVWQTESGQVFLTEAEARWHEFYCAVEHFCVHRHFEKPPFALLREIYHLAGRIHPEANRHG